MRLAKPMPAGCSSLGSRGFPARPQHSRSLVRMLIKQRKEIGVHGQLKESAPFAGIRSGALCSRRCALKKMVFASAHGAHSEFAGHASRLNSASGWLSMCHWQVLLGSNLTLLGQLTRCILPSENGNHSDTLSL